MNKVTTRLNPDGFYLMEDGTASKYHRSIFTLDDIWDRRAEAKEQQGEQ
jgi:hypothetical protein